MKTQEDSNLLNPRHNFADLPSIYSSFETAKVVILPVPYDGTSEWHRGSRYGPKAIIDASEYLELYDFELNQEIYKIGINTLMYIEPISEIPEKVINSVYQNASNLIRNEKFVVMLGGEHSISLGTIKAYKEKYPELSVLQLDAHADLRDEYNGTKHGQATVMRRVREVCPVVQVGIRSLSLEEKQFIDNNNLSLFYKTASQLNKQTIENILQSLTNDVYITVDLDVLDPSIMSAVGLPEPDGMTWQEILELLKTVTCKKNVVGIDFMELCPSQGPSSCAFLVAKMVYRAIGYKFYKWNC